MKVRVSKRPFLLLEVMIAFALVVLTILPLIYPHTYILRTQKEFIKEIDLDLWVNNHYANLIEQLYKNQIPWDVISGQRTLSLNPENLPFSGTLQFTQLKSKPDEITTYGVYLFEITYSFSNKLTYTYHLMLIRDVNAEKVEDNLDNEEDE